MKKTIIASIITFATIAIQALEIPYTNAPEEIQIRLKNAENLANKEQYQSAYNALGPDDNEYIISWKTELLCSSFSQSIMHKIFALSDLKEGQTLQAIRETDSYTFDMVMYDPEKIIQGFVKENGEKPVLDFVLGAYYSDVLTRYSGNWLISDEELTKKAIFHLQKAYDGGAYSQLSLSNLAFHYTKTGDLENAIKIYSDLEHNGLGLNPNDKFNYGNIHYRKKNYQKALELTESTIQDYIDDPQYQSDAFVVCASICIEMNELDKALSFCMEGKKLHDDYRLSLKEISAYSMLDNKKMAMKVAFEIFDKNSEKPAACQIIMKELYNAGKYDWFQDFATEGLKKYAKKPLAKQNLLFHSLQFYIDQNNEEKTKEYANLTYKAFKKSGSLSTEIEEMLKPYR